MRYTSVELMHGLTYQNTYVKKIDLRELLGDDENALANAPQVPSFMIAIDLLSRVASTDKLPQEHVADLVNEISIGDRNRLMLELYQLCMGSFFDLVISCPFCSKDMSLELELKKLLKNSQSPLKKDNTTVDTGKHLLKLRPITGTDQMHYLEMDDSRRSKQEFVKLFIVSSEPPMQADPLPDEIVSAISNRLDEIDPLADPVLDMICPTCQSAFMLPLDIDKLVISGIMVRNSQFQKEIHWLAFYYHWSEESIMSLPVTKRRNYIDLISATLTGELTL